MTTEEREIGAEQLEEIERALAGVLDGLLAERLFHVAGFRNVLVHEYAAVDYALVHEKLGRLDELAAFAAAIDGRLTAQGF